MNTSTMRFASFALSAAALLNGQAMFRGDAAHSGVHAGNGPRQLHGVKWKFATGARITSSPLIVNGLVYAGSADGFVRPGIN
jgi:hypothetical protein